MYEDTEMFSWHSYSIKNWRMRLSWTFDLIERIPRTHADFDHVYKLLFKRRTLPASTLHKTFPVTDYIWKEKDWKLLADQEPIPSRYIKVVNTTESGGVGEVWSPTGVPPLSRVLNHVLVKKCNQIMPFTMKSILNNK